jgi:DNA invertase Pin-like site-specific DNA recombinase
MGALYLKDLADKTRRGLRGRVEAGKSGGGNSYGYDDRLSRDQEDIAHIFKRISFAGGRI